MGSGKVASWFLAMSLAATAASATDQPWIGQEAPVFELESTDSRSVALDELRGSFVVIHFATSW